MSCELSNPMQLGLLVIGATIATNVTWQVEMEGERVLKLCDGVQDQHDPNPPLQQEKPRRVDQSTQYDSDDYGYTREEAEMIQLLTKILEDLDRLAIYLKMIETQQGQNEHEPNHPQQEKRRLLNQLLQLLRNILEELDPFAIYLKMIETQQGQNEHDPNHPQQEKRRLLNQLLQLLRNTSEELDRFAIYLKMIETQQGQDEQQHEQDRDRIISFLQGFPSFCPDIDNTKETLPHQYVKLQRQYPDPFQDVIRKHHEIAERIPKILQETMRQRNRDIQSKDSMQVIEPRCLTLLLMMLMPACLQYLQLFRNKKQICKGRDDITSTSSTVTRLREKDADQASRRQKPTTESVTGFCRQPQVNWSNVRSVLVC